MKTTGQVSTKRYECVHCAHESQISTNHWGEVYSPCRNCSWKRPGQGNIHKCLEPLPEGYAKPEPWTFVRLGDIAKIV